MESSSCTGAHAAVHDVMKPNSLASKAALAASMAAPPNALKETLDFALGLVHRSKDDKLSAQEAERVMTDSINNWQEHVNGGFLEYRKSVAEGRNYAEIEWADGPDGCTVVSASGKTYIDCLGGFGVFNVGRSHPRVVAACQAQLGKMSLHSQELLDPLRGYAAKALTATMPPPNSGKEEDALQFVFFTNSGTESVEACLKMAALASGRKSFFALQGAFHGKTLGSLGATSKAAFRGPLLGVIPRVTHLPLNDVAALRSAFECAAFAGELPAGLIMEPVLGEGGIHVLSDAYLREARALCDKHGVFLIFDEVQSGMGRSGKMWACQWAGVAPDLMAAGKALGGGVAAAGACIGSAKAFTKFFENPFLHTTTFGGAPFVCAGVLAALAVTVDEDLPAAAHAKGAALLGRLQALAARYPRVLKEVRGRGLLIGLQFPDDCIGFRFASKVFARGVLVSGTLVNARVIRVEPPLIISQAHLDAVVAVFDAALAELAAEQLLDAAAGVAGAAQGVAASAGGASVPEPAAPARADGSCSSSSSSGGGADGSGSASGGGVPSSVSPSSTSSSSPGIMSCASGGGGGGAAALPPRAVQHRFRAPPPAPLGSGPVTGGTVAPAQPVAAHAAATAAPPAARHEAGRSGHGAAGSGDDGDGEGSEEEEGSDIVGSLGRGSGSGDYDDETDPDSPVPSRRMSAAGAADHQ